MSNQQWQNLGVDEQIVSSLIKRGINTPFPIQASPFLMHFEEMTCAVKPKQVQEKHLHLVYQWYKTLINLLEITTQED